MVELFARVCVDELGNLIASQFSRSLKIRAAKLQWREHSNSKQRVAIYESEQVQLSLVLD